MTPALEAGLGAMALLLAPGPTNALLATAGAARGLRSALPLLAAELLGYAGAIALLVLAIGPLAMARPEIAWALRLGCALYLAYLALKLWRQDATMDPGGEGAQAIGFRRVLIATLLNPKSLVLAFVLLPVSGSGATVPDLASIVLLAGLILFSGACWIWLGAALRRKAAPRLSLTAIHRAGAIALGCFALALPIVGLLR